jgi:cell division protein FtsI (penicillin-binding protein 3)
MLDVRGIIQKSSNIGAAKIGMKLGWQNLYKYIGLFGFGTKTGIDLPGEQKGIVKKKSRKSDIFVATMSFGQGVSVTPIQLITAFSAIANGGKLMKPYILDRVIDKDGKEIVKNSPVEVRTDVEPSTARMMTELMESVTQSEGTGIKASVSGFTVAGKTGTAQKSDPVTHKYSKDKYVSSFIGYVPSKNPAVAILVLFDEPKGEHYGGVVAGPVFQEIAEKILGYLKIEPQGVAGVVAAKKDLSASIDTSIAKTENLAMVKRNENQASLIESNGFYTMPNLRGLSFTTVAQIVNRKLTPVIKGSGYVMTQNPEPGFRVKRGDTIELTLGEL